MDYKKKYKEALEKARKLCAYPTTEPFISDLQDLFPELKESEDEKIIKALIDEVSRWSEDTGFGRANIPRNNILAWLEKQIKMVSGDKVKPKFKIGDWLLHKKIVYPPFRIIGVHESEYYITSLASSIRFGYEDDYRPWTIQDAKAGDVLCTYECGKTKIVFILKGVPQKNCVFSYYCFYNNMYPSFVTDDGKGCLAPNECDVKPATEAQRDLFFEKMREAGYEWNAEKLELKKIEQESEEWSEELEEKLSNATPEQLAKWREKYFKEDLAEWSKEDERMYKAISIALTRPDAEAYLASWYKTPKDADAWLKSIKDRVQPQSHWKPSEGQLECLDYAIDKAEKDYSPLDNNRIHLTLKALKEQLKKL